MLLHMASDLATKRPSIQTMWFMRWFAIYNVSRATLLRTQRLSITTCVNLTEPGIKSCSHLVQYQSSRKVRSRGQTAHVSKVALGYKTAKLILGEKRLFGSLTGAPNADTLESLMGSGARFSKIRPGDNYRGKGPESLICRYCSRSWFQ